MTTPAEEIPFPDQPLNPPALPAPILKRKTKIRERKFIPSLTVKTESGAQLKVPIDVDANRAANQLLVSQLRQVFSGNIQLINDHKIPLDPKMLADLMASGQRIIEMSDAAYTGKEAPSTGIGAKSDFGKLAEGMMRGAVGAVADTLADKMAKIEALGRKQKRVVEASIKPRGHPKADSDHASTPLDEEPPIEVQE